MILDFFFIIKIILGGLGLITIGWIGWFRENHKSLKCEVGELKERIDILEKQVENNRHTASKMIDDKLEPIKTSLELLSTAVATLNGNIQLLINKVDQNKKPQ